MATVPWRHTATEKTLYFTIRSLANTWWDALRQIWRQFGDEPGEYADYCIMFTETPVGYYFYVATWPVQLTTVSRYWVDIYEQAGDDPAPSDTLVGTIFGYWDGTGLLPGASELTAAYEAAKAAASPQNVRDAMKKTPTPGDPEAGSIDSMLAAVYHASIQLTRDSDNGVDEWTAQWYRNGEPLEEGVTLPTIEVVLRDTGVDLIEEVSMTEIGETGAFKYDEATSERRLPSGSTALAIARAEIDGEARIARRLIGRDS